MKISDITLTSMAKQSKLICCHTLQPANPDNKILNLTVTRQTIHHGEFSKWLKKMRIINQSVKSVITDNMLYVESENSHAERFFILLNTSGVIDYKSKYTC